MASAIALLRAKYRDFTFLYIVWFFLADLLIAGGIAAKILPLIQQGNFMEAFLQKGQMNSLLKQIPVHLI
ncbi:glucokinase [Scytonema sp. HK-05]|uniref:glucokinase n=1 Tax=Scytonema sp. HK-05 TaxID=1137095 RepID=UPI000936E5EF|nr:glucokinase [Scytonema sp. HK-05]OKH57685.1 hypothetical protein NIES2130_18370 [Scytonema sp. HK-05]